MVPVPAKPIIAITMGDPGGVGPEVIARSLQGFERSPDFFYLLIGTSAPFEFLRDNSGLNLPLHPIPTLEPSFLRDDSINFLDVTEQARVLMKTENSHPSLFGKGENKRESAGSKALHQAHMDSDLFDIGRISLTNAAITMTCLKVAAYQGATGLVQAVVTAPINKSAIHLIDPHFHGHTEYLAKIARVTKFAMTFVSPRLRVTLATIHVPLKKVSELISEELVYEKISLTDEFLKKYCGIAKPKLAVCALNPHGREFGEEEDKAIVPAINRARAHRMEVYGPLPGDQVFNDAYEGRVDAVIAMYHDQGLAPFKMISFRDGVNVTLGLPYVRTSPDHGTAFDIAYQGKADPSSMKSALELAKEFLRKK